jgi:hypothetical protein
MGRSVVGLVCLGIVVAIASSIVATAIVVLVLGGSTGSASDAITLFYELLGHNLPASAFLSNLVSNFADKLIVGSVGLAIVRALPGEYSAGLRLPQDGRGVIALSVIGVGLGIAAGLVGVFLPHGT